MARIPTKKEMADLKRGEAGRLSLAKRRFKKQGKEFIIPDDHWSGVMPEKYRANLPGKKESK